MSDKTENGSLENLQTVILIFMVAVYPLVVVPGPLDYFRWPRYVLLTVFSLMALTVFFLMKNKINLYHPSYIPLGLFMIFLFISTALAETPVMALIGSPWRFTGSSTYLSCIFLFLLASQHSNPKQILEPMIFCAVIASMIALMQFYGLYVIPHQYFSKEDALVFSTIGHTNWFGTYVVFILPASILFYLEERSKKWLLTTAFIYAGLLVSLTRGVWLVFLLVFLIIAAIYSRDKKAIRQLVTLIIVFTLITATLSAVNDWRLVRRASTIPDAIASTVSVYDHSFQAEDSVFERIYIWKEVISLVKSNWLFGIGADHLRITMPNGRIEDKAHNFYLEVLVAMGVFALVSYLVFLSFFLRRPKNTTGFVLFIMIISYLIQGFFNNDIVQVMPLFWIVLGLSQGSQKGGYSGFDAVE